MIKIVVFLVLDILRFALPPLSAFWTREVRQPTSEFVAACPCPDGLMQDGTQAGGMRLILSCTGVLVVGVTSVVRERGRERERESPCVLPVSSAPRPCVSPMSTFASSSVNVHQRASTCLRKALYIPFYRYKEMPSRTMGCSYVLTWLAEECLEPCMCANVAVGEVP
jgi:hypothetical protein